MIALILKPLIYMIWDEISLLDGSYGSVMITKMLCEMSHCNVLLAHMKGIAYFNGIENRYGDF